MKKGWEIENLGDVCTFSQGIQVGVKSQKAEMSRGTVRFLRIVDFTQGTELPRYIQNPGEKYLVNSDDVSLVRYGACGFVCRGLEGAIANNIFKVTPDLKILSKNFLYYFLNSPFFQDIITKSVKGVAMPAISFGLIKNIEIPIPPLREQQRIVSVLDEAFVSIAEAKSNAERNLVNAQELFESVLQYEFENAGKSWEEKRLGDVTHLITDGKHGDCRDEENSGYYFLSAKDVKYNTLNYEKARQIKKEDFEETHRRTNLKPGDVLVTNSGTIGRMAIAPDDGKTYKTTFQKSVAIIKPIPSMLDNVFCCYHLKADLSKLVNVSAGTAQKNLLIGDLKNHLMKIPSLAEQRAIVGRLEALSAETGRLEEIYQQKVESLEELKRSVLAKAFAGEL